MVDTMLMEKWCYQCTVRCTGPGESCLYCIFYLFIFHGSTTLLKEWPIYSWWLFRLGYVTDIFSKFKEVTLSYNVSFRHSPSLPAHANSSREPNTRGQVGPIQNSVLWKLQRVKSSSGDLKGASLWASEDVPLRPPSSSHPVPSNRGQMEAQESLSRDKGRNFSLNWRVTQWATSFPNPGGPIWQHPQIHNLLPQK